MICSCDVRLPCVSCLIDRLFIARLWRQGDKDHVDNEGKDDNKHVDCIQNNSEEGLPGITNVSQNRTLTTTGIWMIIVVIFTSLLGYQAECGIPLILGSTNHHVPEICAVSLTIILQCIMTKNIKLHSVKKCQKMSSFLSWMVTWETLLAMLIITPHHTSLLSQNFCDNSILMIFRLMLFLIWESMLCWLGLSAVVFIGYPPNLQTKKSTKIKIVWLSS